MVLKPTPFSPIEVLLCDNSLFLVDSPIAVIERIFALVKPVSLYSVIIVFPFIDNEKVGVTS